MDQQTLTETKTSNHLADVKFEDLTLEAKLGVLQSELEAKLDAFKKNRLALSKKESERILEAVLFFSAYNESEYEKLMASKTQAERFIKKISVDIISLKALILHFALLLDQQQKGEKNDTEIK